MRYLRLLSVMSLLVLIAACAALESDHSASSFPGSVIEANNFGVIMLSTGAVESCTSTSTALTLFDASTNKAVEPRVFIRIDASAIKSEFTTHQGSVSVFSISPGKYYFLPAILNPYVRMTKSSKFIFDVNPGETAYLGEIFMTRSCTLESQFEVRDRFARDWKLAISKNQQLSKRQPVKRSMTIGSWSST